jgi:hypothetical protein
VKFSSAHEMSGGAATRPHAGRSVDRRGDGALCHYPAVGVVCRGCGARVGKPCVSTVPTLGVGAVGVPIDGVHAERVAAARESGVV